MKTFILSMLMLPLFAQAQKFEISEQAGICQSNGLQPDTRAADKNTYGLSNQISLSYHISKHFAVSAFYEYDALNSSANAYGISPDFVSRYFFAGLDIKTSTYSPGDNGISYQHTKYDQSIGYGVHLGSKQKLTNKLSLTEQIGYSSTNVNATFYNTYDGGFVGRYHYSFRETLNTVYARMGLAYRF